MVQSAFERDTGNYILTTVNEGMEVYDYAGNKIGNVTDLYMGTSNPQANERGAGSVTAQSPAARDNSLVEDIARVFGDNGIPEVLQARLLRNGYIEINGGALLNTTYYIQPDQIDQVAGNRIDLRVDRDELIRSGIDDAV
jgi:3D (Asp-Asp-Asp) domain-containing protein